MGTHNTYGPVAYGEKEEYWEEIAAIGGWKDSPWCICGDFNATKTREERSGGRINVKEAEWFINFINNDGMREFIQENATFTHKSARG